MVSRCGADGERTQQTIAATDFESDDAVRTDWIAAAEEVLKIRGTQIARRQSAFRKQVADALLGRVLKNVRRICHVPVSRRVYNIQFVRWPQSMRST
jgi:hypothetical protein